MLKEFLLNIFSKNQGKIIGSLIGLVLAVFILLIGFFRTLLIALFIFAGYYIGKKIDNKEDLIEFLDRILPSGWNR
jgi:Small integral membrane protein